MGLRTHRYGPTATNCRGASNGPGVPRPTLANTQRHATYTAAPATMSTKPGQATGSGVAPPRVRIHKGTYTAPAPGTTTVKRIFEAQGSSATAIPRAVRHPGNRGRVSG